MGSYNEPNPDNYWETSAGADAVNQGPAPDQGPAGVVRTPAPDGGAADLNALYQQYFGRNVDPSGAATFAGQDANAVIQGILGSQEYANIAAAGGGSGNIAPGAIAALGGMDTAPSWLPPTQYAQYGFNAEGKRDKGGLATLQTRTPEGVPAAPPGFTHQGSKSVGGGDDYTGTMLHTYTDAKGGTLNIDQYGNTDYIPGKSFYEEQYAKHPDAVRKGYRNMEYLASGPLDQSVNIAGVGDVGINQTYFQENLIDPNTRQLYKDKSGEYAQIYRPQSSDGVGDIMEQIINTGIMVAGTAIGGPAGAAATAALLSASNDAKTSDVLRNAAIAGGTAFLGGQLMGDGGQSLFGPLGDSVTVPVDYATLADMDLGNAMQNMPTTVSPDAVMPTFDGNIPTEFPTEFPTEVPLSTTANIPTEFPIDIPTAPIVEPDITQVLQQTYPDANIGTIVPDAPLSPEVIQAASLPTGELPPGTLGAGPGSYLPPDAPKDQLLQAAKSRINSNVTNWWDVTSSPVVNAAIKNSIYGAGMGALTSGLTGGSVGKGAMYGGIAGGVTGAGSKYLGQQYFPNGFNPSGNAIADAGIRNALAGATNSAIATKLAGGNAGKAALIGGGTSGILGALMQAYKPEIAALTNGVREGDPVYGQTQAQRIANMDLNTEYERAYGETRYGNYEIADTVTRTQELGTLSLEQQRIQMIDDGMDPLAAQAATRPLPQIEEYLYNNTTDGPTFNEAIDRGRYIEMTVGSEIGQAGIDSINTPLFSNTPLDQQYINQDITEGVPITDTDVTDFIESIIPFVPFAINPPGKNQAPTSSSPGPSGPSKKPTKVPKKGSGKGNFDNYLLKNKVYAGNVYTPEATGFQSVLKEGGEVQHFDIGGSVSNSFSNLFKPVEQAIIQPVGQAAPFLKDVLPYAAMASAPFLGPTAAAGLGALGSGFGTTPGAGFNMKRALMGGIASYGLSNIGTGLAEAGMPASMSLGSIEEPLVGGALQTSAPNPATTGGFWEQITNKANNMQQGASNLMKGGTSFDAAAKAFATKAGMGSAGMAIMGGTGVLGVDEADAQNQAAQGINSSAAQQQAVLANRRAQAKTNAQNAVANNPFRFDMGGVVNPPDDQTGMPNRTPLTRIEQGSSMGYAMGGMANVPRFLSGGGDGMSDSIKANIEGTQEARLADGEFVIPADVVSHLGNGSSKAGAKQLYSMMDRIRQARTGRKAQGREVNPNKFMPV